MADKKRSPDFFILDATMYRADDIALLELAGGPDGHGCWGKIKMKGWPAARIIGDGSYAHDKRHVEHMVAPEFNFTQLRRIMRAKGVAVDDQ